MVMFKGISFCRKAFFLGRHSKDSRRVLIHLSTYRIQTNCNDFVEPIFATQYETVKQSVNSSVL